MDQKQALELAKSTGGEARYEITLGWVIEFMDERGNLVVVDPTGLGIYASYQNYLDGNPIAFTLFED